MENQEIIIDLGFIGNKADKFQKLFEGYSPEPNEHGKFLKFENYSSLVVNKGVTAHTNCFDGSEENFMEMLHTKLMFNF